MSNTNRQIMYSIIGIAILIVGVVGVTFAFFNYTRTGSPNTIKTGNITFNSEQGNTLNITNMFPIKSENVASQTASMDGVTVTLTGATNYVDGEEFVVTLTNVNNTINGKKIPINFIATYTANETNSIGTSSDTYWESRNNKNATIYTLTTTGKVENGKQVLVGYIDNEGNGINGTLTIKAYIDGDKIAISDTYPGRDVYIVNSNMTSEELSDCEDYFAEYTFDSGTTAETFCQGTGTIDNKSFQDMLDSDELSMDISNLLAINVIKLEYTDGTSSEWVNGRTVLTTEEWNSLNTTPISFQITAESNEGIWVEEPARGTIESCPNCKFIYTTSQINTTWNMAGWDDVNNVPIATTPTVIDPTTLSESYLDVVESSGKNYFLGLVTNGSNEVTKAYACGVKNDIPFCIEGYSDNSKYNANKTLLNGTSLWNNTCTEDTSAPSYPYTTCGSWDGSGSLSANADSDGSVFAGVGYDDCCGVDSSGSANCDESAAVGPDPSEPGGGVEPQ